jgi:HEAT repeat protein
MLLVATCGVLGWVGWRVWDELEADPATRQFRETLERLKSAEASERWRAAGNLALFSRPRDIERALPALCQATGDEDTEVRLTAARALGALISYVKHPQRDKSVPPDVVKKWTDEATRALARLLSDPEEMVRVSAVSAFGTMARQPGGRQGISGMARPALRGRSGSENNAAEEPPAEVTAGLANGSVKWNRAAAKALYGYTDDAPPPELVAALKDKSARVRIAAVGALRDYPLNLDATIPVLLSMVETDEPKVREACSSTLRAVWPTAALVPTLRADLTSGSAAVRSLAAFLLGRIGPEASSAVPALVAMLKEPLDASTPRSALSDMQQDPPCSAARALGEISSSDEVIAALTEALKSGAAYRHGAVADGLVESGPRAAVAAPALVAAYTKWLDSKDPLDTGRALTIALGRVAPNTAVAAQAVAALIRALDSKDGRFQLRAAESLARFGRAAAAAVPKLRDLRDKGRSEGLRHAAGSAIEAIEGRTEQSGQTSTSVE